MGVMPMPVGMTAMYVQVWKPKFVSHRECYAHTLLTDGKLSMYMGKRIRCLAEQTNGRWMLFDNQSMYIQGTDDGGGLSYAPYD